MIKQNHLSLEVGDRIQFDEDATLTILEICNGEVRVGIESPVTERQISDLPLRIVIPTAR